MATLKRHRFSVLIVLLALLVGFLYIGPPLMIKKHFEENGNRFVLAQFKTDRDPLYSYLPRAREIYDGHFPPADLTVNQHKPTVMNLLTSSLLALFMRAFRGDVNLSYLGAQFVFSALIFLAFYFLGRGFLGSRTWAIFFAVIGVLTPIALKLPFYDWSGWNEFLAFFVKNFFPLAQTQFDKLYLHEVDNPLLTFPFYLLALSLLYRFWQRPKVPTAVLAAVSTGLLFYVYFHYWVYVLIVAGALLLWVLWKERNDKAKQGAFLWFWGVLTLTAIPYFANYFRFVSQPEIQDLPLRLGIGYGRVIGVNSTNIYDYLVYGAIAIIAYLLYFKKERTKAVFVMSLVAAMVAVWNLQLVIGYVPVPHTWFKAISPIIFIIVFLFARDLTKILAARRPAIDKIAFGLLVVLTLLVVTKKVHNIFAIEQRLQPHLVAYYTFYNEVVDSWDWLNQNLRGEPRIVSPSTMTSLYLSTYTDARPFLPTAFLTLLTMPEMENRYLVSHKLFGVPADILRQRLEGRLPVDCYDYECPPERSSNLNDSLGHLYWNYLASKYGSFNHFLVGGYQPEVIRQARAQTIDELLRRYRDLEVSWSDIDADYVYFGPWEKEIYPVDLLRDKTLAPVYENPLVQIFEIKR